MKRDFLRLALMFTLAIPVAIGMSSCGGDDEDDSISDNQYLPDNDSSGGDERPTTVKRIIKSTCDWTIYSGSQKYSGTNITVYAYDEQGRLISDVEVSSNENKMPGHNYKYTYDGTSFSKMLSDNGVQMSSVTLTTHLFQHNGYMLSWSDDVLTSYKNYSSSTSTYTVNYTNILWPENFFGPLSLFFGNALCAYGVHGKLPRYLPVSVDANYYYPSSGNTVENKDVEKYSYILNDNGTVKEWTLTTIGNNTYKYKLEWADVPAYMGDITNYNNQ